MTQIFLSYAHEDAVRIEGGLKQFRHLADELALKLWQDSKKLRAGDKWHPTIQKAIEDSDIFFLIISNAYVQSGYIKNHELPAIRQSWSIRSALIVPVLWEDCLWNKLMAPFREHSDLTDAPLQALPQSIKGNLKPVREWSPQSKGWLQCCRPLFDQIPDFLDKRPRPPMIAPGKIEATPDGYSLTGSIDASGDVLPLTAQSLIDDIRELLDRLMPHCNRIGNADPNLERAIKDFSRQIKENIGEIDVTRLWTTGNRLSLRVNGAKGSELSTCMDEATVRTLMGDLHSLCENKDAFLMQTEDGRKLISDTLVAGTRAPASRGAIARRSEAVLTPLKDTNGLFVPDTRDLIVTALEALQGKPDAASITSAVHLAVLTIAGFADALSPVAERALREGKIAGPGTVDHGPLAALLRKTLDAVHRSKKQIDEFAKHNEILRGEVTWLKAALDGSKVMTRRRRQGALPPADEIVSLAREYILAGEPIPDQWISQIDTLNLMFQPISDIAPLARLTSLLSLDLDGTNVTNIAPLAKLTSLQSLGLDGTKIADIAPLAKLTSLQRLDLDNTNIADIAPLAKLTSLQSLDLDGTKIADIAPLAKLTSLQSLDLDDTEITDIAPLTKLASLKSLSLNNTKIIDINPLGNLISLQMLFINNTNVSDLTALANLTSLRQLLLNNTKVVDIYPLAALKSLTEIYLSGTNVVDVTPLSGLISLQTLYLNRTKVGSIAPLAELKSLRSLNLSNTTIADITPLEGLTELEELNLSYCYFGGRTISAPKNLKYLNLYKSETIVREFIPPQVEKLIMPDGEIIGYNQETDDHTDFGYWVHEVQRDLGQIE